MENYKLKFEPDLKVVVDLETYLTKVKLDINLEVFYPAQTDGRPWSDGYIADCTKKMTDEVMEEIREKVEAFIKVAAPYNCYGKGN